MAAGNEIFDNLLNDDTLRIDVGPQLVHYGGSFISEGGDEFSAKSLFISHPTVNKEDTESLSVPLQIWLDNHYFQP